MIVMSALEDRFAQQLDLAGYYYEREFKAIPNRKFRYDFFIPPVLLIEIQGGIWQYNPSHASASGIRRDAEKIDLATANGYRILLFTSDMIESGWALKMVRQLTGKGETINYGCKGL